MSHVTHEIASQPECWARAQALAPSVRDALPAPGERVAVIGCGTSWFMAQAYAALRERAAQGETDAFTASEMPLDRRYDRLLAITRSGTTTEVLAVLGRVRGETPTVAITGDASTPVANAADKIVALPFADERSVVQTRFATTTLALLRATLGEDLDPLVRDGERALDAPLSPALLDAEELSFLGVGWTIGIAHEAALKMREAAQAWTESYPAMDYRHGPISITAAGRVAWMFGAPPVGLAEDIARTGGHFESSALDPLADLIRVQRLAVARAEAEGLDPDRPRHLTRSVILSPA